MATVVWVIEFEYRWDVDDGLTKSKAEIVVFFWQFLKLYHFRQQLRYHRMFMDFWELEDRFKILLHMILNRKKNIVETSLD